jgi:methionyl-tRNA synthetase
LSNGGVFLFFLGGKKMNVLIAGAWPYANGSLHLGHVASLLPGDILARYFRMKGENVLYVSGSDCNGTPIAIRAKQEGVPTSIVTDRYHNEFSDCFKQLGFSYDLYSRTDHEHHHKEVQRIFATLMKKGYIYKKSVEQTFCQNCNQFLPDRYVEGTCPHCHNPARGDQCDFCSKILDPLELIDKTCKLCGEEPVIRSTEHFYFALSQFQNELEKYLNKAKSEKAWRENAISLSERYLAEGLLDRAATRDLDWGISVPVQGYTEKKIYVWIEAVSGYLTCSKLWAIENDKEWEPFWGTDATAYYVHGKDNIPFHTIIWPSILLGLGDLHVPDHIVSGEYLTVEKNKLSTSKNWAVWVPDILKQYHPDSIRYFLTINAPEKRDTDFSWREFIYSHNSELLGAFGNLVNRTFKFTEKYFEGKIPHSTANSELLKDLNQIYQKAGSLIEEGECKRALETIFAFVRKCNKYFDEEKPWITIVEDDGRCRNTIYNCVLAIANLANLLHPFLPFSSEMVKQILASTHYKWELIETVEGQLGNVEPLFERIDVQRIEIEKQKLGLV